MRVDGLSAILVPCLTNPVSDIPPCSPATSTNTCWAEQPAPGETASSAPRALSEILAELAKLAKLEDEIAAGMKSLEALLK